MNQLRFLAAVAWRNLWRHRRRSLITASAMAVAVALCMATIAFQDGMFEMLFDVMVEDQLGHVQVSHPDYAAKRVLYDTVPELDQRLATIDALDGTVAAAPRLEGYALIGGAKESAGGLLVGLDPARDRAVTRLEEQIVSGRPLGDDAAHEVLVGTGLADDIEVGVGDAIVVVTQATDGSIGNDVYDVVGVVKTGNAAVDRGGALMHLADLQTLLVLDDQAHRITVLTDDPDTIESYTERLTAALDTDAVAAQPWWEASPQTAEMMAMQDASAVLVLGIVFLVAAFGVLNTMMMSVFERTRELGVLKAIGLRPTRMVALIVFESFFLAGVAATLGLLLGGVLDWWLVVYGLDFSASMDGPLSFNGVTLDPVFKGVVRPITIVFVVISVFVVSVGASLLPAWRAASLAPVEAIRTE